ncbi:MAG: VPLPA-CTERM sorting domain-containing protein [Roseobacter sp.]
MFNKPLGGLTAAFLLSALPSLAATFDFAGGNLDANDQMTVDGISVTALAGIYQDRPFSGADSDAIVNLDCSTTFLCFDSVTDNQNGLGLSGGPDSLDGNGLIFDELLTLQFSESVRIVNVTFSNFGASDSYDLFTDGTLFPPEERTASPFEPVNLTIASSISFGADAFDDRFRVRSITVEAVPLPASGLLLLGAFGGFAAMRRRK